ncbi:unnamed protein product [Staurois parvus]|uniref:Uncharacterized protein n=1 Tax=Staurois parvus TaxID=386267 RepID=A0ABN9H4E9_9NEOB|nr:unnamed protein product [Staurois parvus]
MLPRFSPAPPPAEPAALDLLLREVQRRQQRPVWFIQLQLGSERHKLPRPPDRLLPIH